MPTLSAAMQERIDLLDRTVQTNSNPLHQWAHFGDLFIRGEEGNILEGTYFEYRLSGKRRRVGMMIRPIINQYGQSLIPFEWLAEQQDQYWYFLPPHTFIFESKRCPVFRSDRYPGKVAFHRGNAEEDLFLFHVDGEIVVKQSIVRVRPSSGSSGLV